MSNPDDKHTIMYLEKKNCTTVSEIAVGKVQCNVSKT